VSGPRGIEQQYVTLRFREVSGGRSDLHARVDQLERLIL
jgi:hypothetical protein